MRLRQFWALATIVALAQGGAAFAEVTVSQSNSPAMGLAEQISSLMGVEHSFIGALAPKTLSAVVQGKSKTKKPTSVAPADGQLRYEEAFLATQPAPNGDAEWQCLRKALYFEARG